MHITVAICSWNRAALLDQTLDRMECLHIPESVTWELLIANNNCTDNTDEIIQKHSQALPIKRVFEPNQGLSNARNSVINHANGEVILWTDDDVIVERDFIRNYESAFRSFTNSTFFGGKVDPLYETTPANWISDNIDLISDVFALRDFGPECRKMLNTESPVGASMAIKTSIAKKYMYKTELGRHGANLVGGEETEYFERLRKDGHHGVWVGNATLKHFIPTSRLTKEYLWKWKHGSGRTLARHLNSDNVRKFRGTPLWVLRRYVECTLKRAAVCQSSRSWLISFLDHAHSSGMLAEYMSNA
jgi:glycosyltransferase involved in cell wall biosynthesis